MLEHLPTNPSLAEKLPPTHKRLVAYLQSLQIHQGENEKDAIQGQVQIEVKDLQNRNEAGDTVYQESAIYGYELEGNTFVLRAANPEGAIVAYRSVDEDLSIFEDEKEIKYKVNFPGFVG